MIGRRSTAASSAPRLLGLLAAPILAGLLLCAGAVAYWTASGGGSASAALATQQPLTLTPGTPSSQLYPGGSADVALTISNPNPYPVGVPALVLDTAQGSGGFGVDSEHSGCGLATLGFTAQSNGGAGWTVPAKVGGVEGSLSVDLSGAVSMGLSAASACQGASFSIFLKASS
jgi:hypothetical protein